MNNNKQIGEPCEQCHTPLIQGKKGPYCKDCYIKWKNNQDGGNTYKPQAPKQGVDWDSIAKGKVRNGICLALLGQGKTIDQILEHKDKVEMLEDYIMGAKKKFKEFSLPDTDGHAPSHPKTDEDINVENIPF